MQQFLPSILFFLLFIFPALSQDRVVSGVLTGDDGSPLPGVSIVVKGTATGTTSDASGRYSIKAPLGATLVFSFIGFTSSEVVVSERNSSPVGGKEANPATTSTPRRTCPAGQGRDTLINRRGVASLSDASPGYVQKGSQNRFGQAAGNPVIPVAYSVKFLHPRWARFWYGSKGANGLFVVKDQPQTLPFRVTFTSSFTLDQVSQLPNLQNTYGHGRPLNGQTTWRGAETGEVFSWGPALGSLEYTGTAYDYDRNGPLTTAGSGNGNRVVAYSPYRFFRTGTTVDNAVSVSKQLGDTRFSVSASRKDQQHIIPGAGLYRNNLNTKLGTTLRSRLGIDYSLALSETSGRLLQRGGNLTGIFSSVLRTPPSFDNAGGIPAKEASTNSTAWLLPDGQHRSYSPGNTDNPYWLAHALPDQERLRQLISNLSLKYSLNDLSFAYTASLEKQRNNSFFGLPATAVGFPEGRFTSRKELANAFRSSLSSSYKRWLSRSYLDAGLLYDFSYGQRAVNRQNSFGFAPGEPLAGATADSVSAITAFRRRQLHELRASAGLNYRDFLYLNLYNRSYFSSTTDRAFGLLPGAGLAFTFTTLNPFRNQSVVTFGKLRSSYAKTLQEAPLLYPNWHYASTQIPVTRYQGYYEAGELALSTGLQPEVLHKFEAGSEIAFWHRLTLEFNYFQHLTKGALFPVYASTGFSLLNGADMTSRGVDGSLRYSHYGKGLNWEVGLTWSRVTPVVKRLYGGRQRIPLAGFAEVSTNLVAGQPVGVIYGSTFERNGHGDRRIGPDGYPLVSDKLSPIGNPNPDWTAGLSGNLSWKTLSLSFVVDVRKGGDSWNGTGQVLNYYGVSQLTGQQREVRDYVFKGVKSDGSPNDVSVDFAAPASGLEGNRWVRYGLTGVAEEAIRDGSWVRLNEVKFSCNCTRLFRSLLPHSDVRISCIGKNLLLLTRYPGVDPSATLFGYNWGAGLDLFNVPNTRSYGLSLNVKL